MKKKIALIALFYFIVYSLVAQVRISGSIIDQKTKEPILYATVSFPEKNIGTVSDGDGKFSIYIADTTACKSLVFSCVGYQREIIPIIHLLKEKTVMMKTIVNNLSGVEVKAMSYNALLELTDKVFCKARLNTKSTRCKVLYSLESDKNDVPLELIEAFYSGTQSMRYGVEEMKLKNGRIGLNLETDNKIMNISSTNLIINFLPYNIPANNFGVPAMPSNYNLKDLAENFSFYEDGMFKEDTASLKKISFYSKEKKEIEGFILFYTNSLQMKQYDIQIHNVEKVLFPAIKGDRVDSLNIHLVYTYKKDEKNRDNVLLERINMDYSLNYYAVQTGNNFFINTSAFFLFYDYEAPFIQDSFGKEFGINAEYRRQFGQKYRNEKSKIETILDKTSEQDEAYLPLFTPIFKKSEVSKPAIKEIRAKITTTGNPSLNDLLSSYIRLTINRLFRSQQRAHELVLYDYLFRYYNSLQAREKNQSTIPNS